MRDGGTSLERPTDALTALRSRGVSLGAPTASARYGGKKHGGVS